MCLKNTHINEKHKNREHSLCMHAFICSDIILAHTNL
jgi:hypothetical protein